MRLKHDGRAMSRVVHRQKKTSLVWCWRRRSEWYRLWSSIGADTEALECAIASRVGSGWLGLARVGSGWPRRDSNEPQKVDAFGDCKIPVIDPTRVGTRDGLGRLTWVTDWRECWVTGFAVVNSLDFGRELSLTGGRGDLSFRRNLINHC